MVFNWEGMKRRSPENITGRGESRARESMPPKRLAESYADQAKKLFEGPKGIAAREETARFSEKVRIAREGLEEDEVCDTFWAALRARGIDPDVADDKHERKAYLLALILEHQKTGH